MSASALELLRLLGSGVRPVDAPAPLRAPIEGADFGALLREAQSGALTSGRSVRPARGMEGLLTDNQIDRLSTAADAAEGAGATRLGAIIDGQMVEIDIGAREVVGARSLDEIRGASPEGVMTGVDAVVVVPTEGDPSEWRVATAESVRAVAGAQGRAPALRAVNPAVAELLAGLEARRSA